MAPSLMMSTRETPSPSGASAITRPRATELAIPLHVNIGPRSVSSVSSCETGYRPHCVHQDQDKARIVIRVRPLRPSERSSGEQYCIRPLSPKTEQWDDSKNKKKSVLSPSTSQVNSFIIRGQPSRLTMSSSSSHNGSWGSSNSSFKPDEKIWEKEVTSLISGTENRVRFDFDQVIQPGMTQQQCYDRAVGDLVRRNVQDGRDTTIVALGSRKSGLTYTINGDWKPNRKAGSHIGFNRFLNESAGILPRAVDDLFCASKSIVEECKSTISMAVYMIACEGGHTRDMLSKFTNKSKVLIKGVTYLRVDSPQEVKRVMDRVLERSASYIKDGRTFHLFVSFRMASFETKDSKTERCCTLNVVRLMTVSDRATPEDQDNLRDLLECIAMSPKSSRSESRKSSKSLMQRLDDTLLGVKSPIIIGCVSPIQSHLEDSTELLRLCVMARTAKYFISSKSGGPLPTGSRSVSSSSFMHAGVPGSALWELQQTLQQADQAAKNAREGSASLDAAATKWRSHRQKLSRASTIAALSQMTTMTTKKDGRQPSGVFSHSTSTQRQHLREKPECAIYRQNVKTKRYGQQHGLRLLREKEELRCEVGKLKKESKQQVQHIKTLEEELACVTRSLNEEKQISSKLEDIRNILKRKSILQDHRIQFLEQRMAAQTLKSEVDRKAPQNFHSILDELLELQRSCGPKETALKTDNRTMILPTNKQRIPNDPWEHNPEMAKDSILAALDDSLDKDAIYLPGDDVGSLISRESSIMLPPKKSDANWSAASKSNGIIDSTTARPIPNNNTFHKVASCECQQPFFTSEHNDKIEFYLPSLRVSCLCGKQQLELSSLSTDLVRVDSILRPWQTEFLASVGIFQIEDFVETHLKNGKRLARQLIEWRANQGLEVMTKSSCTIALLVWARACSVIMRSRTTQTAAPHELLEISSLESIALSSLGF